MTDQEIIETLGLGAAVPELQAVSIEQARELVELRVAGILERAMSDEQRKAFDELKEQSPEAVADWIEREFADIDELRHEVLNDFARQLAADSSSDSSY